MLEYCPGAFHQELPACLRSGRFRDGAGAPRPLPLRWAFAARTAGGQIHSPTVITPLTLNQPTSTDDRAEPWTVARTCLRSRSKAGR